MTDRRIYKEICERIAFLSKQSGKTQEVLSNELGMQRTQLGRVINGTLNPTLQQVCDISSLFSVRAGWLIDGEEPMLKEKSGPFQVPDQLVVQLRKQAEDLLVSLHTLSASLDVPEEENVNQASAFPALKQGKSQSNDKR